MTLTASPALNGYDARIGELRLFEEVDLTLVSIAIPVGGETKAGAALGKGLGAALPRPGASTRTGPCQIIQTGADQYMAIFDTDCTEAKGLLGDALGGTVYTTDQSDVWVGLALSGPGARAALERLCPIDLHDSAFPVGAAARTVMEHMGAIILRRDADAYLLLSARSSAASFLHAVETSIRYTQV